MVGILRELGQEARVMLTDEAIPPERQEIRYFVDMRYYRQGYEMPIAVHEAEFEQDLIPLLVQRFNELHDRTYGFMLDTNVEIVNLRAVGIGRVTKVELPEAEPGDPDPSSAYSGEHQLYRHGEWITAKLYDRNKLRPGMQVEGPAIITEVDSTTVVLPGHTATVDRYFNLLINRS
jgi:N-methylhydantoinase A